MVERRPAETFSPGEHIAGGLEERGVSELEFANELGWHLTKAHWLIRHEGIMLPPDIKAVAAYFGTSEELWENLQVSHFDFVYRELEERKEASSPEGK